MANASVSLYELIVPQFMLELKALKNILIKGQSWAETKKLDQTVLLNTRLIPDQFALNRQIQIACDSAKFAVARLCAIEVPAFEDKEQSFEEFQTRIDKTIQILEGCKPEMFEGFESRRATFSFRPGVYLEGKTYLIQHVIPNFYFHITTAYAILRASGVTLGKEDFLGQQDWKNA